LRNLLSFSVFLGVILAAQPGSALTLAFPVDILREEGRSEAFASYALPLAPFDGTSVPSRTVEGELDQRAFQLDAPGLSTLAILAPLRDQIVADGFAVVFECEARACGGFDFRFGTEVIPEPDMHVDMGDYLFLSAEKDGEVLSLLVSRTAFAAFVQVTRVKDAPVPESPPKVVVDLDAEKTLTEVVTGANESLGIASRLDQEGRSALDDLVFDSGSSALTEGEYASLAEVVAWLEANPEDTIALVGHTDAAGSLAANIALSERRAEAVAQALIDIYGADRSRIAAEGVGFLAPRATNFSEEGRQRNRRVEVVVTSTR
jgi:outer membrane protein OmpA-like peptidoglycan-associated protein